MRETEGINDGIQIELVAHTDRLNKNREKLLTVNEDLTESQQILTKMAAIIRRNKLVLSVVLGAVVLAIIIIVSFVIIKKNKASAQTGQTGNWLANCVLFNLNAWCVYVPLPVWFIKTARYRIFSVHIPFIKHSNGVRENIMWYYEVSCRLCLGRPSSSSGSLCPPTQFGSHFFVYASFMSQLNFFGHQSLLACLFSDLSDSLRKEHSLIFFLLWVLQHPLP